MVRLKGRVQIHPGVDSENATVEGAVLGPDEAAEAKHSTRLPVRAPIIRAAWGEIDSIPLGPVGTIEWGFSCRCPTVIANGFRATPLPSGVAL